MSLITVKKLRAFIKKHARRKKSAITTDAEYCDWRDLSPDKPPLPLLPLQENHVAEQAPKLKTIPSFRPTISRTLHMIHEEKEEEIPSEDAAQSLQSPCEGINRSPSVSSFSSSSSDLVGNEMECKSIFLKMIKKALLRQKRSYNKTKIVFDENDNVKGLEFHSNLIPCKNPQFIPPEAALGDTFNHLADVWVLGVSLYRMLVGKYPFSATDDRKLFKKMLRADFTIPSQLSEDVKDLLKLMLAPAETRASLDLVMFHPWLKPYRISMPERNSPPSSLPPPSDSRKRQRNFSKSVTHKRRKVKGGLVSVIRFLLRGPYPPPKHPYRELGHLGRQTVI